MKQKLFLNGLFEKLRKGLSDKLDTTVHSVSSLKNYTWKTTDEGTKDVLSSLGKMQNSIQSLIPEIKKNKPEKIDISDVVSKLEELKNSIGSLTFPEITKEKTGMPEIIAALSKIEKRILPYPLQLSLKESSSILDGLLSIENTLGTLPKPEKITIPDSFSMREAGQITNLLADIRMELAKLPKQFPSQSVSVDVEGIITSIEALHSEIRSLPKDFPTIEFPDTISVNNFPPFPVPNPVTNININGLQGFLETTSVTVGTSIVKLPDYGQLFNRRAVIIYNNSANTIYIGGSEVTVDNGLPIPASSYSPPIDAGYQLIIYGVASQAGNNVRVMEISKDKSETVQQ